MLEFLSDDALEKSGIVANCRMNRERDLTGSNGYSREIGFNPLDYLRDIGTAVRWLDLCCGTARALGEAAQIAEAEGWASKIEIIGVDLIGFRRLSWGDVIYTLMALAVCSLASGVIFFVWAGIANSTSVITQPELTPPFVHMEPLTPDTMWLLAAWLPLFFFNITGEELWWRGYILPRQEQQHGKQAWLVHTAGLTLFHLPLGVDLAIILLPFLAALPWVVQRRQNLWTGFLFHGLLNGGGFMAVAFGVV